nr:zf-CCHC domain-containing protein/DUF4219 domain-containing protein/UBN2 domain-containing protein [Tanacetum cinerariifolium]
MKETPYELIKDEQKKQLGKNNEAKMTIYNALSHKEYERVFMCKTTKEVLHARIITHQGNSQVKNCKIDFLTQEYENYSISNEETIDSDFIRFNAIVTCPKSLDPDHSSKNHGKTSDDNDSQGEIDKDVDEEGGEAFNLMAKNFRKGNRFKQGNRFGNGANRLRRGRINSFGNKGGESSRQKGVCYNYRVDGHFASGCTNPKENKAFVERA